MSNNNTIFRKSSLDRVSSPEQLNDYIKVTRPSVWLVLAAVIVLLISVCVWGVYGKLTTTCDALTVVNNGSAICYVTPEQAKKLAPDMEVQLEGGVGKIVSLASAPIEVADDFDTYALYLGGLQLGDWVVPVNVEIEVPDGAYIAKIVLETISPISFVLN